jgi:hypothetical protein
LYFLGDESFSGECLPVDFEAGTRASERKKIKKFLLNDYYNNKLSSATRACLL